MMWDVGGDSVRPKDHCSGLYDRGRSGLNFALARYNTGGAPDNTFSGNGKVITDFGGNDVASSVAVQADGKIVVAGTGSFATFISSEFALARYNKKGTLDKTFNSTGKVLTGFGGNDDEGISVAISGGKIVVAGYTTASGGDYDFAVARYFENNAAPANIISEVDTVKDSKEVTIQGMRIYPNPVPGILHIEGQHVFSSALVLIADISGTVMQKRIVSGSQFEFDVSKLHRGLYNVSITENKFTIDLKFIKQ